MALPIGYHKFHRNAFINYQLNRWNSLGYVRREEIEEAGRQIRNLKDYVSIFQQLADKAQKEGRSKNAAFYLRAAEFFIPPSDPDKKPAYERFRKAFYLAFSDEDMQQHVVPYGASSIPATDLAPKGDKKGTILFFGGFDSLIEEFFCIWKHFSDQGYRVIAFEGPGQGGALRLYDQVFDHDYEKPVAAVLDHFDIQEATLIGMSMGGYWAIRAAAFEPRIKRVVAWAVVYDWISRLPGFAQSMVKWMATKRGFMNASVRLRMRLIPILDYTINHLLFITGKQEPVGAVQWFLQMNRDHIHSERVTQDVLLLGGAKDSFQPPSLVRNQEKALVNSRSVQSRIFTQEEHAAMHCQMGNLDLVLGVIGGWLEGDK